MVSVGPESIKVPDCARLQMRPNALNLTSTAATGSSSIFCNMGSSSVSLKGAFMDSEGPHKDDKHGKKKRRNTFVSWFSQTHSTSILIIFKWKIFFFNSMRKLGFAGIGVGKGCAWGLSRGSGWSRSLRFSGVPFLRKTQVWSKRRLAHFLILYKTEFSILLIFFSFFLPERLFFSCFLFFLRMAGTWTKVQTGANGPLIDYLTLKLILTLKSTIVLTLTLGLGLGLRLGLKL